MHIHIPKQFRHSWVLLKCNSIWFVSNRIHQWWWWLYQMQAHNFCFRLVNCVEWNGSKKYDSLVFIFWISFNFVSFYFNLFPSSNYVVEAKFSSGFCFNSSLMRSPAFVHEHVGERKIENLCDARKNRLNILNIESNWVNSMKLWTGQNQ